MRARALVIGINEYQSPEIGSLRYAEADARAIASAFAEIDVARIPTEGQIVLCNQAATRSAILEGLSFLEAGTEDLALFYYAGHGCSSPTRGLRGDPDDRLKKYIVPHDADPDRLGHTAIDFLAIAKKLKNLRSARVLAFFDACYSGAIGGRTFSPAHVRGEGRVVGTEYLNALGGAGRIVMAACTGKEVASEDPTYQHGLFTHLLLHGLRGAADYRSDGWVDVDELCMYLQTETVSLSKGKQNPVRSGFTQGESIKLHKVDRVPLTKERAEDLELSLTQKFCDVRLQRVRISSDDSLRSLGGVAAAYLQETLRSNSRIAVSCGRSLIEAISQMNRSRMTNVEILPLNGSPTAQVRLSDSMVLSYLLWSKFEPGRAQAHVIPTGIPDAVFKAMGGEVAKIASEVLTRAALADCFLFGIGPLTAVNNNIKHLLSLSGITAERLAKLGAVGEINFQLFDAKGSFLLMNPSLTKSEREDVSSYGAVAFALSAQNFYDVSRRSGVDLVAVAGGLEKRAAVLAAIRGQLVRTLITDEATAEWLIGAQ